MLVNLGTPDNPQPAAVARYLREFLSDPRVIDYPRWLWFFILNGIIIPVRSRKVAKAYQTIWGSDGSPLRSGTEYLTDKIRGQLGSDTVVDYAMTYGNPSVESVLNKMLAQGVEKLVVLPLYPQYSATTTAAAWDVLNKALFKVRNLPELRFVKQYSDRPAYINALAASIKHFRAKNNSDSQLLVFSFHGLPKRYVELGDPYRDQCEQTARDTAQALGLSDDQWTMCFQSRVGREEWLKPYTDDVLETLPGKGIHKIDVVCPAFACDCLETLEEIAMESKSVFIEAGGEVFDYIPALNAGDEHVTVLLGLVEEQMNGW